MNLSLILASASPRRAELLTAAGYAFDVLAVDVDEARRPGEAPEKYVERLAREKADAACATLGGHDGERVVLAADTTVVVDDEILAKPVDAADARRMLELLSGRTHRVLTGVAARCNRHVLSRVEMTEVSFSKLSDPDIDWYVRSGEGRDKAGGYGIQGLASRFVSRIHGSYSNVVGLPIATVHELVTELRQRAAKS